MNFTVLKEKIKTAQLDYGYLQNVQHSIVNILSEKRSNQCPKCTKGCSLTGVNKCHIGCALFAAIG